jgi:hypothetical protein
MSNGPKIKIAFSAFTAFRHRNMLFEYREKGKSHWLDAKAAFMPVLYSKDEFTLFGWLAQNSQKVYYLEIGQQLHYLNIDNVWSVLFGLFDDNDALVKLMIEVYDYDHLPLIVKYYATKTGT